MARVSKRRPQVAKRATRRQQDATLYLLRRYDHDPQFVATVATLIEHHGDSVAWIAEQRLSWEAVAYRSTRHDVVALCSGLPAYRDDVVALAIDWGLSRIPEDRGLIALHSWMVNWPNAGEPLSGLGGGLMWMHFCDAPDGAIHIELVDRWDPEDEPIGDHTERVPERLLPLYDYQVNVTSLGAKGRLLRRCEALIDAELDRIARAYEQDGFMFEDTAHRRDWHMQWLYERLAHRRPVRHIADAAGVSEGAVRKETERLKNDLGIPQLPTAKRLPKK